MGTMSHAVSLLTSSFEISGQFDTGFNAEAKRHYGVYTLLSRTSFRHLIVGRPEHGVNSGHD
jgi:hypothetical protein